MGSFHDEWHIAASRVSPLIWEIQKNTGWSPIMAKEKLKKLTKLSKVLGKSGDFVGILTSEPEMESVRDRLVIMPILPESPYPMEPLLLERARPIEVYNAEGKIEYSGTPIPEQHTDFLRWCSGYFIRLVGVKPKA